MSVYDHTHNPNLVLTQRAQPCGTRHVHPRQPVIGTLLSGCGPLPTDQRATGEQPGRAY